MTPEQAESLIHLRKMHPTPWTLEDAEAWGHEDVIRDADGHEVSFGGVEEAVVAAVNAYAEQALPPRPDPAQEG